MKIDDRISSYMALLNNEAKPISPTVDSAATGVGADKPSVKVAISSEAMQLADDEARRARVELIRQRLSEGTYSISGKDVANKMLNVLKG